MRSISTCGFGPRHVSHTIGTSTSSPGSPPVMAPLISSEIEGGCWVWRQGPRSGHGLKEASRTVVGVRSCRRVLEKGFRGGMRTEPSKYCERARARNAVRSLPRKRRQRAQTSRNCSSTPGPGWLEDLSRCSLGFSSLLDLFAPLHCCLSQGPHPVFPKIPAKSQKSCCIVRFAGLFCPENPRQSQWATCVAAAIRRRI